MKKLAMILGILVFAMFLHLPTAGAQAPPGPIVPVQQPAPAPGTPEAREAQAAKTVTAYTLPPDVRQKAERLEKIRVWFFTLSPIYGIVVLWLFLRWEFGPKFRDWAEVASGKFFLQVLIFAPLFVLASDIFSLPLGIYQNHVEREYGLSVQGWGSWAWDWTKGELVSVVIGFVLILILYFVIRRFPRIWWLLFWLATMVVILVVTFLQPVVIDPMFHKFEPMQTKNPALTVALEQMIQRAGQDIPPERIYWMNASEKSNELNAYVTGIGASKRMVVWDTTIAKMNTPQIVGVAGHEMGHYVLNHITKGLVIAAAGLLVIFYLGYRCIGWLLPRWGDGWGIRSLGDLASLPALLILVSIAGLVLTPVTNKISRHFEHQADQYALEVTHGLTPDSSQVAAQMFQILGEVDLEAPDPGPFDIFMTYNHPAIRDRVRFSLTYDPWAKGGTGEFVH